MGWWRWAQVGLDGVAPSRMAGVSASVSLPLHHKRTSILDLLTRVVRKRAVKQLWLCGGVVVYCVYSIET